MVGCYRLYCRPLCQVRYGPLDESALERGGRGLRGFGIWWGSGWEVGTWYVCWLDVCY